MLERHCIIGSGPVGSTLATHLADLGHEVVVVTRSGSGPNRPSIERIAADASDVDALAGAARGAATIYNCANPPYHRWPEVWPALHAAVMAAAQRTNARLVLMDNLYAFGPATAMRMNDQSPMRATGRKGSTRAAMATALFEAHARGDIRGVTVRASDFFGPGVRDAAMGERVMPRLLRDKPVSVLGSLDAPHSFSYMPDVAATLGAIGTCADDAQWGRAWMVPNDNALTQRQFLELAAHHAGTKLRARVVPKAVLHAAGVFVPAMRELRETLYQFTDPFVVDSGETQRVLGVVPTPLDAALRTTIEWWRSEAARV